MSEFEVNKTYAEINARIKAGEAVVVTAEEMTDIVKADGPVEAARKVDVVTTGTFSIMCSSGAFFNFGQTTPTIKAAKVWVNKVPAYAGLAAVDIYLGSTEPSEDDPLNKIYPGEFRYGGGHVIVMPTPSAKRNSRWMKSRMHCSVIPGMHIRITTAQSIYPTKPYIPTWAP